MKVTYLSIDSLQEGIGASQVLAYVERLAARGVRVQLHTFEKNAPEPTISKRLSARSIDWKVHDFGHFGSWGGLSRILRAANAIRGARLVHARSDLAAAAALLARAPLWVWDFRSFYTDQKLELGELKRGSYEEKILRLVERRSARACSAIITLTDAAIPVLANRHGEEILHKAHVITTAVDTNRFTPTSMPPTRPLRMLLAGTINNYYDVPLMLDFARVAADSLEAELHIVTPSSTGWDSELDEVAHSRRSATPEEMHEVVASSHIGLSVCREDAGVSLKGSMPTKIGEFLASGRPVVVNRGLGDAGTLLKKWRCGVTLGNRSEGAIAEAVAQVEELVADPGTVERCRKLAIRHFDLDEAVDRLATIYAELEKRAEGSRSG